MKIGDRVYFYEESSLIGNVIDIVEDSVIWVKWDINSISLPYPKRYIRVLEKQKNHPHTNIFK